MTVGIDIIKQVRENPDFNPSNSWNWFQHHVRQFAEGKLKPSNMFHQTDVTVSKVFLPGQMMSFFYSAKHKDNMPYFDKFPLVLPFSKTATHFTGLNLHYLPVKTRMVLFNKLLSVVSNSDLDEKARLKLSWSFLKNASKFPEVAPCVKQYIHGYVKSQYMIIAPKSWVIALFLPTESFNNGTSVRKVWSDTTGYRYRGHK